MTFVCTGEYYQRRRPGEYEKGTGAAREHTFFSCRMVEEVVLARGDQYRE